jgi:peptidoglycan/LPS O-acetylase OafA/YrhL
VEPIVESEFRLEIQLLRAIAIISVLSNHLRFPYLTLPAGFHGVDIFFVVSGFVISNSIIRHQAVEKKFRVGSFLLRRVTRLYPALFVTTIFIFICSLATQSYIHVQQETAGAGRSSTLFLSNYWFARKHVSYFSPLYPNPMLHTWSLNVEEQFYIGLAVVLLILGLFRASVVGRVSMLVVGILFFVSLSLSVRPSLLPSFDRSPFYFSDEEISFYSLHTRAWEILLGVLIALGIRNSHTLRKLGSKEWLRRICVPTSVICLVLALFLTGTQNHFGFGLAMATGSTSVILFFIPHRINWLSSNFLGRLLVIIGNLSYVVYLVHWPIIIYGNQLFGESVFVKAIEVLVIIGLTYLVGHFVERSMMSRRFSKSNWIWLGFAIGQVTVFILMTVLLNVGNTEQIKHGGTVAWQQVDGRCDSNKVQCNTNIPGATKSVLLIGDSHSGAFVNSYVEAVDSSRMNAVSLSPAKLDSVLNYDFSMLSNGLDWTVVVYFHTINADNNWADSIVELLRKLRDDYDVSHFIVFLDNPLIDNWRAPSFISQPKGISLEHALDLRSSSLEEAVVNLAKTGFPVQIIDPFKYLCRNDSCPAQVDGIDLYFDADHLAIGGADLLRLPFKELLLSWGG